MGKLLTKTGEAGNEAVKTEAGRRKTRETGARGADVVII